MICSNAWQSSRLFLNKAESKAEYDRLIAEFLANGRRLQNDADATVVEVLNAYRKFAENYYRKDALGLATHHGLPGKVTCWLPKMILPRRLGRSRRWWRCER
jgi:hypothetical protein